MYTDLNVGMYWGEMGVDFWDANIWSQHFARHEVDIANFIEHYNFISNTSIGFSFCIHSRFILMALFRFCSMVLFICSLDSVI